MRRSDDSNRGQRQRPSKEGATGFGDARMGLVDYTADLYCWWTWEMAQTPLLRRFSGAPAAAATLRLGRSGVQIERAGNGRVVEDAVEPAKAGSRVKALAAAGALPRGAVDIVIEGDRHLQRRLSRLRLPRSRMRRMARLDYDAATPFRPGECVLIMPEYRESRPETSYFIVRRSHLDPLLDGLRRAGILVRRVLCAGDGAEDGNLAVADRASVAAIYRAPFTARVGRIATRAAAATAALTLIALPAMAHWRYSAAIAAVSAEVAAAEREAEVVRRSIEERDRQIAKIAAARRAKSEAVPLVQVMEELARTLPDSTWLTDVEFQEGTVTFSGLSNAAAELIPSLDAAPLFMAPTFSLPVVRDGEQGVERFTITMRTEATGG